MKFKRGDILDLGFPGDVSIILGFDMYNGELCYKSLDLPLKTTMGYTYRDSIKLADEQWELITTFFREDES